MAGKRYDFHQKYWHSFFLRGVVSLNDFLFVTHSNVTFLSFIRVKFRVLPYVMPNEMSFLQDFTQKTPMYNSVNVLLYLTIFTFMG